MSNKTIANFLSFVIFIATASVLFSACSPASSSSVENEAASNFGPPVVIGTIKSPDITESSGIAASRCQSGVLWTHNDSGDDAFIFAINFKGDSLGTWKIPNAQNIDWEDIATYKDKSGKCFIYIGEIGDNRARRAEHAVYRVAEPTVTPAAAVSTRQAPITTENASVIRFGYPERNSDAETLMVNPKNGDIYIVTKRVSGPASVFRLRPEFDRGETVKAEKVAELSVPAIPNGFLTGGEISSDGRRMIICDYTRGYEYTLPDTAMNFDDIWKQSPELVNLGKREVGEAVCYSVDGTSIFATSEGKNPSIIEVKRKYN